MKYQTEVVDRHSYKMLVIREVETQDEEGRDTTSPFPVGTLRFEDDAQGIKSLELWQKMIAGIES